MSITIRRVRADDLGDVLPMIHELAAHHRDRATVTETDLARDMLGRAAWMPAYMARKVGRPAGYVALLRLGQAQWGVRGMEMHHLMVVPDMRRQGIGAALVAAAQAAARRHGARYLAVGTDAANISAQAFYTSLGFAPRPDRGPRYAIRLDPPA